MDIGVIGTGCVGLVTGSCFAESGNSVICMDVDTEKIELIKGGVLHIYEPGLRELIERNIRENRLSFTTDLEHVVRNSHIIFIAVSTPPREDGSADLGAVLDVARSIGKLLYDYKIIVTKSTVPVGTTEKVRELVGQNTQVEFDVASNPEFLKEGAAVEDFMKPDRVVIGVDNPSVGEVLKELYQPFMRSGDRTIVVSIRSSEIAKYASNAMLATRISFMNEMANLCDLVGADVAEVRVAMGADSRIGRHYLFPGVGYGGSCFPKDVKAIIQTARELGYELKVCSATEEVNRMQRERFFEGILDFFGGDLKGRRFGVWGLSFKPRTDDIREAPSLFVIERILSHGGRVAVHDPAAIENARLCLGDRVEYVESSYDACGGADALVVLTEWNEYRQPDFDRLKSSMSGAVIFDGRNLYDPRKLAEKGFKYFAFGRSNTEG
ncbi:MAG: UDP-glucose/GDP-mannose dehydrogenase family protein [Candidatus Dadabacteria bacterium]|nr:UDP-glucose/GDP-mannose dehydrogenase family protein [Candidatus Dadabacteria bacterium]